MTAKSLGRAYFDNIYARDSDPWRFASSVYEREKYKTTLAALAKQRYAFALEVGCSIGVLTQMLAERCDQLLAMDISPLPLSEARRRCIDSPWVKFAEMAAPSDWPEERFDLILMSEVVYYLGRNDVRALAARIRETLIPGGELALVHWTDATDYPLTGDEAVELLLQELNGLAEQVRHERFEHFRLDTIRRAEAT